MARELSEMPRWMRPVARVAATRAGSLWFLKVANPIDKRLLPATGGRITTAPGYPILVIEHVGAKSGARRRTPLTYATDGDDLVIIASAGGAPKHPAWYHNVKANPEVRVWSRRHRGTFVAREVEGAERERKWRRAVDLYPGYETYQRRAGSRRIPVIALSPKE